MLCLKLEWRYLSNERSFVPPLSSFTVPTGCAIRYNARRTAAALPEEQEQDEALQYSERV